MCSHLYMSMCKCHSGFRVWRDINVYVCFRHGPNTISSCYSLCLIVNDIASGVIDSCHTTDSARSCVTDWFDPRWSIVNVWSWESIWKRVVHHILTRTSLSLSRTLYIWRCKRYIGQYIRIQYTWSWVITLGGVSVQYYKSVNLVYRFCLFNLFVIEWQYNMKWTCPVLSL